jgi:hypothetical protein
MSNTFDAPRQKALGWRIFLGVISSPFFLFGIGTIWKIWVDAQVWISKLPLVENFGGRNAGFGEGTIGIIAVGIGFYLLLLAIFKKRFDEE